MNWNELREDVVSAWEVTLSVDISGEADFFELGGHSFMAMRIIAILDEKYQTSLPMDIIFDYPRLDDFVAEVFKRIASQA